MNANAIYERIQLTEESTAQSKKNAQLTKYEIITPVAT